jgi:ABC-type xylose transport system substrate-binding protein
MSATRPKPEDTQSAKAFIADNWRAEADVLFTVAWNRKDSIVTENDLVVAVYANHETAEAAVQELQQAGFDMKKLSIVGKDYHTEEHVIGCYNAGDRMKYWEVGSF